MKIPSYRKHKPSGRAVVTLCGKDYYLGKYGTKDSKEEYSKYISEYLKGLGEEVPAELLVRRSRKPLTIVEVADRYFTQTKATRSKVEQSHVKGMLKVLVGMYENERVDNFLPSDLREVRRAMIANDWSRTYVNDQTDRVQRMYKWLVIEGLVPEPVYRAIALIRGLKRGEDGVRETPPVRLVEDSVVEATLPYLQETVADMVRLQRLTGMRPVEVCILRPCDLDRSSDVWIYRPATHKTQRFGHERVVYIAPKAQAVLKRYLFRDSQSYCFSPRESEAKRRTPRGRGKGNPVDFHDKYDVTTYRRAIHRACDKAFPHPNLAEAKEPTDAQRAELRKWRREHRWAPNRLRHTAATAIRREHGMDAARVLLGHREASTTQIYAERDLSVGLDIARKLG